MRLLLSLCLALSLHSAFGKILYVYTTFGSGAKGEKVRIQIGHEGYLELSKARIWQGDVGNQDTLTVTASVLYRDGQVKAQVLMKDAELAFLHVEITKTGLTLTQTHYPNVPKYAQAFYEARLPKASGGTSVAAQTGLTDQKIKAEWDKVGMDAYEGIYQLVNGEAGPRYILALKRNEAAHQYELLYIYHFGRSSQAFTTGEVMGTMAAKGNLGQYKGQWIGGQPDKAKDIFIDMGDGRFTLTYAGKSRHLAYVRTYPSPKSSSGSRSGTASGEDRVSGQGSGFALSEKGYLATNHHVVDEGRRFFVRGVGGDGTKRYEATVVKTDPRNDLAILKITDPAFITLGAVPYRFQPQVANLGSDIYVLGYPLSTQLGKEVKLTNGIINSRNGMQDEVTMYQISAEAAPGNSGGPVFDAAGNVVAVLKGTYKNEPGQGYSVTNANYAIKASYLMALVESCDEKIPVTKVSAEAAPAPGAFLKNLDAIRTYVYMIEVE